MSCLVFKKRTRSQIIPLIELPPLDDERKLILIPKAITNFREKKLKNKTITISNPMDRSP